GFVSGWSYWMSNVFYFPSRALATAVMGLYIFGTRYASLEQSHAYALVASLTLLFIAIYVSVIGWQAWKWIQNIGGLGNWLPIVFLVLIAVFVWIRFGLANPIRPGFLFSRFSLFGLILFFSYLCFVFAGFVILPNVSE